MRKLDVYTERLYVFISKEQKKKLEEIANKKLLKHSEIVRIAIDEYLQNHASEVKQ